MTSTRHSLPYKKCTVAKQCTAPSHFSTPNSRFCIDFYLPQGTPILASRPGVVTETESRYNKSYSSKSFMPKCNYVYIRHDDGQESIYAHLAWHSVTVKVGQRVRRGQVIGLSGQTGYATYPHLHFGVYDSDDNNIRLIFNTSLPVKVSYRIYPLDKNFFIACSRPKDKYEPTRKQRNCPHSDEKRVEEIGQGCGFGLVCKDCNLLLETSPTNIYG